MTIKGEVTIQTLAMPADTNANGDIFGDGLSLNGLGSGSISKKIIERKSRYCRD